MSEHPIPTSAPDASKNTIDGVHATPSSRAHACAVVARPSGVVSGVAAASEKRATSNRATCSSTSRRRKPSRCISSHAAQSTVSKTTASGFAPGRRVRS